MRAAKTFREVATASLDASRARLRPGTVAKYENLLDKKLLPRFGARRISAITTEDVEKWIADIVASGLAPNTVHNHYVLLNKTFRYPLRHRLNPFNPADGRMFAARISRPPSAPGAGWRRWLLRCPCR